MRLISRITSSGKPSGKQGYSLIEVMLSMTVTTVIGAALLANIGLQREVFVFTRANNQNVMQSGLLMHALKHGTGDFWGLKLASRENAVLTATGVTSASGVPGWQIVTPHNLPGTLSAPLTTATQTFVYNPITEIITVNGRTIGEDVVDSYADLDDGYLSLGIRVEEDGAQEETTMETRIYLRNP